jgi:hypothetical protein
MDENESLDGSDIIENENRVEAELSEEDFHNFYEGLEKVFKDSTGDEGEVSDSDTVDDTNIDEFSPLPENVKGQLSYKNIKEPSKLKVLSPVRKVEPIEIDLPEKEENLVSYKNFLHLEIGESVELFNMRKRLAEIFAKSVFNLKGKIFELNNQAIMILSRMVANKFWYDVKYNESQEKFIDSVIQYIPELKDL